MVKTKSINKLFVLTTIFFLLTTIALLPKSLISTGLKNNNLSIAGVSKKDLLLETIEQKYLRESPTPQEVEEGELKGIVASLKDPFSEYLSESEFQDFQNSINQRYEGIGIRFEKQGDAFVILQVFGGSPALEAGLQKNDVIVEVAGESVANFSSDMLATNIKGPENSQVKLKVFREDEFLEFDIARKKIQVDLITKEKFDDKMLITISSFGENLSQNMDVIAKDTLNDKDVKEIILDLRSNNGGLLNEGINISSYFLEEDSVVVIEKSKNGEKILRSNKVENSLKDYPVTILVDGFTASASEIVAGALRDNKAHKLVGQKTFGKGVVQQIYNLMVVCSNLQRRNGSAQVNKQFMKLA
ncbi:PDZ domain-containing protein [Candidatus Gracilibacteria bacterium]|nr:PDZ domain-containing protein [Candidatus Gracilibacteria bacterium]